MELQTLIQLFFTWLILQKPVELPEFWKPQIEGFKVVELIVVWLL